MASGLPDYSRVVRPRQGGANLASNTKVAVASAITFLLNVKGKGIIYGGVMLISYTSTQKNSFPTIYIDGVQMVSGSFYATNFYALNKPDTLLFYELKYDDVNFVYAVALTPGITFESEVTIAIKEQHGTTPTVITWMTYALM